MRRILLITLFLAASASAVSVYVLMWSDVGTIEYVADRSAAAKPATDARVEEYVIQSGDTFATIGEAVRVPFEEVQAILQATNGVYDFTTIRAGQVIRFFFAEKVLAAVEYPISSEEVVVVEKNGTDFSASKQLIEYKVEIANGKGVIADSLFAAAEEVGIEDKVTLELATIFSGDIDFATDIREGDSFSIVYEKRSLDGKDAGSGNVLAARFTNDGKTFEAFRYKDAFYDADGNSLARQFLKSPLNYAQITSGFSYQRTNPVTKQVTPHRAIDYAAPSGTPVIATADGTVSLAGSKGGLGITVELKHGNYLTQYAHLSSLAKGIKKGADIVQGDVIGYVGSTGISTGPHLQYAMFDGGTPINPLTIESDRSEPVSESERGSFDDAKRGYIEKL